MRAADAYAAGYTGLGVTVGVVDSGIYIAHPEFADGRVKPLTITGTFGSDGYYFMNGSGAPDDRSPQLSFFDKGEPYTVPGTYDPAVNDPHGTHVTGSIAASRNGVGMHGVAFDASVYVANTHTTDEGNYGANADYAYFKNAYGSLAAAGARAINSSWGSPPPTDNYNTIPGLRQAYTKFDGQLGYVDALSDVAKQYGIIQVFAAGNTGWDNPNVRSSLPYFRPEIEKNWLAVGAADRGINKSTDPDDVILAGFSNRAGVAKYWYVVAPGEDINSTVPTYTRSAVWNANEWGIDPNHQTGYTTVGGTSMAAPHATGALAVIMQRYPYMTNTQARDVLLTTAYHRDAVDGVPDANPNAPNAVWGWGLIDLDKAMRGPGQFLGSVAANLPAGVKDTWSNDISEDALIQRKQENDAEAATWATRKATLDSRLQTPVLTAGLPASRTALDGVVSALRNGSESGITNAIKAANDDPVANQVLATFIRSNGYDSVWPLTDPAYASARTDVGNLLNSYISGLTSADYDSTIAQIVRDWQNESRFEPLRIAAFADIPTQGSLIKLGDGTLTLSGTNTFSGGVTFAGGTLSVARDANLGAAGGPLAFDGGTLQITGTAFTATTRPITWGQNGGGLDIADPANTFTLAQALSGPGGLTKLGAGTLALAGTNTYTGATTLAEGTLLAQGGQAIGDLSAVTIAAGATLALADGETIGSLAGQGRVALVSARLTAGGDNTSTTFAGTLDGTGGLTKAGAGTLTLTGASTYTGGTTIAAGTLSAANAAALGTSVATVTAGGTLDVNSVTLANALTLAGTGAGGVGALTGTGTAGVSGAITLAGNAALGGSGTLTLSGTIGDGGNGYGLSKVGTGTAILTGANTYTGTTTISGGTLALAGAGSLSAASGVALATGARFDIAGLAGAGTTIAGLVDTAAGQAGTVTLGSKTLTLADASGSFGGSIAGTGGLTLTAGTQTLTGTSTYSGRTTIAGGTLALAGAGSLGAASGVALATGARFDIAGLAGAGTTIASLSDTAAGQAGTVALGAKTLTIASASGSFGGGISGTGSLSLTGGTQALTGASTYSGGTTIAAGALSVANAAALGTGAATVAAAATLDVNSVTIANTLTLAGTGAGGVGALTGTGTAGVSGAITLAGNAALGGSGTLTLSGPIGDGGNGYGLSKIGTGTAILTGASSYTGATTIWGGTLALAGAGSLGASGVALAAGARFDIAGLAGAGTTIAGLADAAGEAGTVTLGSKTLTLADASGSFSGSIAGTGGLSLTGGRQILTGTSTYTGATTVADATLEIDGVLSASEVTVRRGGTLSGTGKIGDPLIEAGGRLAPGSAAAIGTLAIHGPLTFAPGAFYTVRITPTANDRTDVTGPVTIQGGTVQVLAGSGTYTPALRYTLLTATGGITGTFTSLQTTSNLAFLTPSLSYETHGIALGFAQTAPLTSVATSPNQARIAGALNGTGPTVTSTPTTAGGAPAVTTSVSATGTVTTAVSTGTGTTTVVSSPAAQVTTALLNQTASGAVRALNSLSGEIQGSAASVRAQTAVAAQGSLLEHLRFGAGPAGGLGLTGAAGQRFAPGTTLTAGYAALTPDEPATGLVPVRPLAPRYAVWGQAFGVFGSSDATRNTARLTRETGGFVLGAETGPGVLGDGLGAVLDGWRFGVAGGTSVTQFDATTRQSSGRIEGSFGGAYINGTLGPVQVRLGALYGRDALDTRRTVLFPGFSQAVSGRAGGSTLQGFGEIGYRIGGAERYVEPFVGGAVLRMRRDGFTETGGSAALAAFGRTDLIETATAGVQAQAVVADLFGGAGPLLAQGLIGYRRAFGDVAPAALVTFRGSTAFRTAGAPLAPDAAVASAGLDWAVARGTVVGLSYDGQLGVRTREHAIKASLSYRW
ncbi:S8 family serine peptidase [Methylobacterium phyllostachyos]|nr:S8 family serine peptidase [Methylobacterium phyllostachyos]